MMTVKQVSTVTGVSVRTLQFYDEIGLLKPTAMTEAGYRLYDESALKALQQILFFKELDFTLKEIKGIMENPHFDQAAALEKQRKLIQIKRDRLNAMLDLLDKLVKGETCMAFQDFDMSGYFQVLNEFKAEYTDEIVSRLGAMEPFEEILEVLKANEGDIAEMAVKTYGGVEEFTEAMKENLSKFLTEGPSVQKEDVNDLIAKTEQLTRALTEDLSRDVASLEVQEAVKALIAFTEECSKGINMGKNYWESMAEMYLSNPVYIEVNDMKYGAGASKFMGLAIRAYLGSR